MFLVVIGVLSIVLAFPAPLYRGLREPGPVIAAVAAAVLLPALIAAIMTRRTLHLLESRPETPGDGQLLFSRGMLVIQGILGLSHAAVLLATDWLELCRRIRVIGDWPVVPGFLATIPFLAAVILVWAITHPADRAVREIALEMNLFRGRPVRPVWSLREHLLFNLRHQVLFILIPMFLILAARDVILRYEEALLRVTHHEYATDALLGLSAAIVAVIAPGILRHVWVTQRLPDGPLRDRLQNLCRKLRLRCREILVWRSGGMIINAAVMGLIPPLRYVLITDAMLEQMDDRKIEGVFGHEAGHVKRHHILFFLLFAAISGCLVTVFSARASVLFQQGRLNRSTYEFAATIGGALLLVKWGVVFGWISRRFERQADIYGVRTLAISGMPCSGPCALHGTADAPVSPAGGASTPESSASLLAVAAPAPAQALATRSVLALQAPLCATAANVFSNALNEVAILNGIPPEARSWRHSSISSRSRFLQKLAQDPDQARRFERGVWWVKAAILVIAVVCALWAGWETSIWKLVGVD